VVSETRTQGPQRVEHGWPAPGEHFWTDWRNYNTITQYRTCIHPKCSKVDYRDTPKR
jgi:hypothetical protein